jgi:hypothetical protein
MAVAGNVRPYDVKLIQCLHIRIFIIITFASQLSVKFALVLIVIIKLFLLVHGTTNMTGMQDAHPFCDLDTR